MENSPFYNPLVIVVFALIGLIFIAFGLRKNKRSFTLTGIGFSIFLSLLLYTFIFNPNMANALSAFSTIALAVFAGATLFIHYQTTKDAQDRENRERKERLLNEIIEWAEKSSQSAIYRQTLDNPELWKAKLNYKNSRAKSAYIKELASTSFPTLISYVDNTTKQLDEAIASTSNLIESHVRNNYENMRNCEEELTSAGIELFKEAARIKTKDIS